MHIKVTTYLEAVKKMFPKYFENTEVLDVGAFNINGTNRAVLSNCDYIGLDIIKGPNIDVVCPIKDYNPGKKFSTIFCTEMLEHDKDWKLSLLHMYNLLKDKGILVVTCAGIGRREHGTKDRGPEDSPATNNYYRNIDSQDILSVFPTAKIEEDEDRSDIRFYVIKK